MNKKSTLLLVLIPVISLTISVFLYYYLYEPYNNPFDINAKARADDFELKVKSQLGHLASECYIVLSGNAAQSFISQLSVIHNPTRVNSDAFLNHITTFKTSYNLYVTRIGNDFYLTAYTYESNLVFSEITTP